MTQAHDFIKGAQKLISIAQDLSLVQGFAKTADNLGKKVQRINVLQDVRLPVGDENHVKLVERLVNIAHVVLFHSGVLGA